MIYLATDWHLWKYDKKLGVCKKRKNYNAILINAKKEIKADDIFIYLGDLTDGEMKSDEKIAGIFSDIPGYKILIIGNNDTMAVNAYKNAGFDKVVDCAVLGNIIFTHHPCYVGPGQLNVHGHNHGRPNARTSAQNIDAWTKDRSVISLEDVLSGNKPDTAINITDKKWQEIRKNGEKTYVSDPLDLKELYLNGVDGSPVDESVFRRDESLSVSAFMEALDVSPEDYRRQYIDKIEKLCESYFNETLEYRLGSHPKGKYVTLYHGSPVQGLSEIRPESFNRGTRFSKARYSSFWSDDIEIAQIMGYWSLLAHAYTNFNDMQWYIDFKRKKFVVPESMEGKIYRHTRIKNSKISVYIATMPADLIGKGHDPKVGEYSIDVYVYPHHEITFNTATVENRFLEVLSNDEYALTTKYGQINVGRNIPLRDKFVYLNPTQSSMKREKFLKALHDAREYGVRNFRKQQGLSSISEAVSINEVLLQDFEDAKDFETDDDTSRAAQDPNRQTTYRIRFRKRINKGKDEIDNDAPSVNESSIQDSYQFELLDKSVHFYDKIDEAASYQAKGKLYEKFGFKLKKTFNSNGENGYEKGRFRWYQLDESAGVINEMAYEDYCDCFYAKLKSLAAQYNKRDDIFKHVAKVLKMEQKDLPKFDCHIQVSGEKQLCFSLVNSDTSFEIRCEYEKYLKEMIEDLEKDVDIKTKCPHIKSIWTADAEGTIYVNLDYEHINEAIADTHSLDREQKKRIADKYGLRQGGYGQRTSKEDEDRMKKSAEWEKKIPLKQRKKIYREDGHPEELIPSHEEVRDPVDDCLPIAEAASDSEIEKLLELNRKLNKYDYIDNSTGKNYKLRSPSQFESDHGETFKDSPYVKYRKVMYLPHVRGKVGGFIDVYTFSSEPETGIIVIAVEPAARGTGLSQKLVQKAIDDAPSLGIKKLIWRADTDNIASIKLAQKMGFADISDLKKNPDQYKYEMALNEAAKSSLKVNTSLYFISKDRLDEAASNSSKSHVYTEPLYRITYNDIGIYEAYKKACSFDEWRSFINSDAATWLDVPKIYNKDINHTSYFTKRGYELFQKNTYPVIIQKLNKRNIKVDQVVLDVKPVYEDLYQVVVPNSVNESIIFNKATQAFNLDKWKPGKHNALFVVGMSGSGKSTFAEKLEKSGKGVMVELDGLEQGFDSTNMGVLDELAKVSKTFKDYTNNIHAAKNSEDLKKLIDKHFRANYWTEWGPKLLDVLHNKFPNTLFIVEGVQPFNSSYDWKCNLSEEPVIIVGTSMVNSILRRFKRNAQYDGFDKIQWTKELKNEFIELVRWYLDQNKDLDKFRKTLKEDINEYSLEETNSIIELTQPLMQEEMHEAMLRYMRENNIPYNDIVDEAVRGYKRRKVVNIQRGQYAKANARRAARKPKDDLDSSSIFEGIRKSVSIDSQNAMIVIKGINFAKTLARIKNMYNTKRVNKLFDPTYSKWSLFLYNNEQITRGEMKIIDLKVPLFFALELHQIFLDLAQYYQLSYYEDLANMIYKKTWISNVDKPVQKSEVNLDKLNMFTIKPLDYQLGYIQEYFNITRCYNFDGHILTFKPGYGKTFTAVCIAEVAPDVDQMVVVCPNSIKENWAYEIKGYYKKYQDDEQLWKDEVYVEGISRYKFNKNKAKWIITNQESISKIYNKVATKNVMIIVDESQYFRNMDGVRVKELLKLKDLTNATEVLMMSGTPIKASPDELIPALLMIDPMFTYDLAKIYKSAFATDNTALERVIRSRFGIVMYDVEGDVLKLPEKNINEMQLEIKNDEKYALHIVHAAITERYLHYYAQLGSTAEQYKIDFRNIVNKYSSADKDITRQYIKFVDDGSNYLSVHESKADIFRTFLKDNVYPNISDSAEMKRVKEVMANYVYLSSKARGLAMGEIMPPLYNGVNIQMWDEHEDMFIDMINGNLKKTIIFSPYLKVVNHISERLTKRGIGNVKITGSVHGNRMDIIQEFKKSDDIDVLVATDKTMGVGVTLIEASQVFFFGVPWRASDFEQASDRVHRIGQTSVVNIYKVLLKCKNGYANITTRQNEVMEWSDKMTTAYSGIKHKIENTEFEFATIEEAGTAIQRAVAYWGDDDPDPIYGPESLETDWRKNGDSKTGKVDEKDLDDISESINDAPDDSDSDLERVDGNKFQLHLDGDPLNGDDIDDDWTVTEGAMSVSEKCVTIPITDNNRVYFDTETVRFFAAWIEDVYSHMKKELVGGAKPNPKGVAILRYTIGLMNKFMVIADKSVSLYTLDSLQLAIRTAERLLRNYVDLCDEWHISWTDVSKEAELIYANYQHKLSNIETADMAFGKKVYLIQTESL